MSDELGYSHEGLRTKAIQAQKVEQVIHSLQNQRRALGEDLPDIALIAVDQGIEQLKPIRAGLMKDLPKIIEGSPLGEWISQTHGLGKGLVLLLGVCPPLTDFDGPAALWKYVGLDVRHPDACPDCGEDLSFEDDGVHCAYCGAEVRGKAPRGARGERLGFDPKRRAYAIMRVADPVMKVGGPYREVYDERKAHTQETHPPMFDASGELLHPECGDCQRAIGKTAEHREGKEYERERKAPSFDCANVGGVHWTDGHRHADALRVTAKAILRDAWRVAHGQAPRVGQVVADTHRLTAPAGASA